MKLAMCLSALAAAWVCSAGAGAAERMSVRTDSYPVAYFAERIGSDQVSVFLPVPPDRDPALWTPSITDIADYQQADLILLNGAGLAAWTKTATLPRGRMIDTSSGFADRLILTAGVTHSHGPEGEHSHADTASFTWLDLDLARQQAEAILEALVSRSPKTEPQLRQNFEDLDKDLAALDARAEAVGEFAQGRAMISSHPSYQYLARAYGFEIESVSWDSEGPPSDAELAELDTILAERRAMIMLWEERPSPEVAAALDSRGLSSVVFPTLANRPSEGDFVSVLEESLERLEGILARH